MFCNKCGAQLNNGDAFCGACGNSLNSLPQQAPQSQYGYTAPRQNSAAISQKTIIIAGIAILAALVIIVVLILNPFGGSGSVEGDWELNIGMISGSYDESIVMSFEKNGTFRATDRSGYEEITGTYKAKGNTLSLKVDIPYEGTVTADFSYQIRKDELTVKLLSVSGIPFTDMGGYQAAMIEGIKSLSITLYRV